MAKKTQSGVLADHKKIGKKLIPPVTASFGEKLQLSSWPRIGVPEVLWIALLEESERDRGARLADDLAKAARAINATHTFGVVSDFRHMSDEEGTKVWGSLSSDVRDRLAIALSPLINAYPTCPLRRVIQLDSAQADFERLKRVVSELLSKTSVLATMTLATLLYITVNSGRLYLHPESRLLHLNRIRTYPATDEARLMASEVRTSTIMCFMPPHYDGDRWPAEFWNRGLELEGCTLDR